MPDSGPAPPAGPQHLASSGFRVDATGCEEGGSYVTWNAFEGDYNFPPPFQPLDVSDDVGRPPTTSLGGNPGDVHAGPGLVPSDNVTGAYHAVVHCAAWSLDGVAKGELWFAFVAVRIVPPPFDPAPVAREYFAGVFGAADPGLVATLLGAGFVLDDLTSVALTLDGRVDQSMQYAHHGDIVASIPLRGDGAKEAETVRLWTQVPVDDTHWRPLALDLVDTGGQRLVASAPGAFEHTAPSVQSPAPGAPLHTFTSWALAYQGFDRTLVPGPTADVVLEGRMLH